MTALVKKISIALLFCAAVSAAVAQQPVYIVNGQPSDEVRVAAIPPADIECVENLPADEETIARYGEGASNGVIIISLKYDTAARFSVDSLSLGDYVARRVRWDADEPAARVVLRYVVGTDGRAVVETELESTDNRLRRRVLKALAEAPGWSPAMKNGVPVESRGVLRIQLPEGKPMPRMRELVIR